MTTMTQLETAKKKIGEKRERTRTNESSVRAVKRGLVAGDDVTIMSIMCLAFTAKTNLCGEKRFLLLLLLVRSVINACDFGMSDTRTRYA